MDFNLRKRVRHFGLTAVFLFFMIMVMTNVVIMIKAGQKCNEYNKVAYGIRK
jgi:hypothetical protein